MKKRFTAILLVLCMALTLLPMQALADETEDIPALEDGASVPLPEDTLPEEEKKMEETAPAVAVRDAQTSDAAESEPLPETMPPETEEAVPPNAASDQEASADLQEGYAFTVTTETAAEITAFSATLSMTITGDWEEYEDYTKYYGFQYCVGDTFREENMFYWEVSYNGNGGRVDELSDTSRRYTGPVSCMPGTTYTYRAYIDINGENGYQRCASDTEQTFTTPDISEEPSTLFPDIPISVDLISGESACFSLSLGDAQPGFYKLSYELSEETSAWGEFSIEKNGTWGYASSSEPLYLDSQSKYGKVTLSGDFEGAVTCTVTLSPYEMTVLPSNGTVGPFTNTAYLQFAPEISSGMYTLTFSLTKGEENPDPSYWGNLVQWSGNDKDWTGSTLLSDGLTCLLSPEAGEICCLRLDLSYDTACTITVSEYTPVTSISVCSGNAETINSSNVRIPLTVEIPVDCDPQTIRAGIEYQTGGHSRTFIADGSREGTMWMLQCYLNNTDLFPERTYQYRAFVDVLEDDGWDARETIRENEWHTFTAPAVPFTSLTLGQTDGPFDGSNDYKYLSFVPAPEESGRYTVSMTGWAQKYFWNEDQAGWEWDRSADGEAKTLTVTADKPLYIIARMEPSREASVTLNQFTATVETFSIRAEMPGPDNMEAFSVRIPVSASMPIDSSFRIGLEVNGTDMNFDRMINWEGESWRGDIHLEVFPNADYTCIPYIQPLDAQFRPAGSPVYGSGIRFRSSDVPAEALTTGVSETKEVSFRNQFFCFTPEADGFYQISVTGEGVLNRWDAAASCWNGDRFFESTAVIVSAKANEKQFFRLMPLNTESASLQIRIDPYTSTVTEFSVKADRVVSAIPGFSVSTDIEVELPLGSYCWVGLEVQQDTGEWRSSGGSFVSSMNGEKQIVRYNMMTIPETAYTFRAYLSPADSDGHELAGAPSVCGQPMQFTSIAYSADTTTPLTVDNPESGVFQGDDLFFSFKAPKTGFYEVTVSGSMNLYVSQPDTGDWSYHNLNEPVIFPMEEGTERYFRFDGDWNQSYRIQVSEVVSTVTGFTVAADEAAIEDVEFRVPITVAAPIGSEYIYGVEYSQDGGNQEICKEDAIRFSLREEQTFFISLPAYPGKIYTWRAYVFDPNEGETYYEETEHTVIMPALETEPLVLEENTWTAPAVGKSIYSFTPAADGDYLFTAGGEYGTLTILQEDGTWNPLYYSIDYGMTIHLPFQAGKRVYVIQEEDSWSETPCSVMVRPISRNAVLVLDYSNDQVTASMDAEAPGKYLFAAYDQNGKILAFNTINKTGDARETLTATFSAGRDVRWVKAFQLDASYKPQAAAKRTPIVVSSIGETDKIKDFFVFKEYSLTLVNGRIVYIADGWDIKGNEISLNLGTKDPGERYKPGDLVEYTNVGTEDSADWVLKDHAADGEVYSLTATDGYEIKASDSRISISDAKEDAEDCPYIANDVKFIFVTFDGENVASIEIKNGVQNVGSAGLKEKGGSNYGAQLCLDENGWVKAVVIKKGSNIAVSTNLLFVRDWDGYSIDGNGNRIYQYTVDMMTRDGLVKEQEIYSDCELRADDFASYTSSSHDMFSPFYKLRRYDAQNVTISTNSAVVNEVINRNMVRLGGYTSYPTNLSSTKDMGIGDSANVVIMSHTEWLDLTGNGINSIDDLGDFIDRDRYPKIQMIYNDNPEHDNFRMVSLVIVCGFSNTKADVPDAEAETSGTLTTDSVEIAETPAKT